MTIKAASRLKWTSSPVRGSNRGWRIMKIWLLTTEKYKLTKSHSKFATCFYRQHRVLNNSLHQSPYNNQMNREFLNLYRNLLERNMRHGNLFIKWLKLRKSSFPTTREEKFKDVLKALKSINCFGATKMLPYMQSPTGFSKLISLIRAWRSNKKKELWILKISLCWRQSFNC